MQDKKSVISFKSDANFESTATKDFVQKSNTFANKDFLDQEIIKPDHFGFSPVGRKAPKLKEIQEHAELSSSLEH